MADIYSPNVAPVQLDLFYFQWYSVMAQLKAGWLLKHSSNGTAKATYSQTSNPADPLNCRWATPGIVQDFSTTGTASITSQYGKDFLIKGLSGLVAPTKTNRGGSEGNLLTLSNCNTTGNNTTWMITRVLSSTSCYARPITPSQVTQWGTSPPTVSIAGHVSRAKKFNIRIETVVSGALGTAQVKIRMNPTESFAPAVIVPTSGIIEVIDVNGVATGIYLTFNGSISNLDNFWTVSSADANDSSTSIRWVERSWLTSAYSAMANGAWICLEGPCTLKIPFTSLPVGTFIRGENVVQTTSNAEGEVLGITYDTSGAGYLVIIPRLNGTGNGAEGWGTGMITGGKSSAYVTPSGLPTRLVREMVWWRGTTRKEGTWYYQPILDSTENSQRFGWLSLQSGCTNLIAPGGGGTNNGFPSIGYAVTGTGGSASHNSQAWGNTTYALTSRIGNMQLFTANCIDRQDQSPDGSFVSIISQPAQSSQSTGNLPVFMMLNGTEEGDIEPYAAWCGMASGQTTRNRDGATTGVSVIGGTESWAVGAPWVGASFGWWATWRRRGLGILDAYISVPTYFPFSPSAGAYANVYANNVSTDLDRVSSTLQANQNIVLQSVELASSTANTRMRKGTLRWIYLLTGRYTLDTYDGKKWVQCNLATANSIAGLGAVIPYNESTAPTYS